MAVIFTDFSEYTTGATSLADWDDIWLVGDAKLIIDSASFASPYPASTKALQMYKDTSSIDSCYSWSSLDGITTCDILAKVCLTSSSYQGNGIWICASGRKGKEQGYNFFFNSSSAGCYKYVSGAITTISSVVSADCGATLAPTDLWIRISYNATTGALKYKVWKPTQLEPTAWLWEGTDSSPLTDGVIGLGSMNAGTGQYEYLKVTTGTDIPTPYTALIDPFEWGTIYWGNSSTFYPTLASSWQGGTWNLTDKQITAIEIKMGLDHSTQARVAIYSGGSLATGPDGATLLHDCGQTTGSGTQEILSIPVSPALKVASGTFLWFVVKSEAGVSFYQTEDANAHDFDWDPRSNVTYANSNLVGDPNVAFPATASISSYTDGQRCMPCCIVYEDAPSGEDIKSTPGLGQPSVTGFVPLAYGGAPDLSVQTGSATVTGFAPVMPYAEAFTTDFTGNTTGAFPSDWTDVFTSITNGSEIVAYSGDGAIGSKSFWTEALADVGAGKYWHTWDTPGVLTDFEALVLVHKDFDSFPPCPITFRMSGGVTDFTGYQLSLDGSLRKYVDGITSTAFENSYVSYVSGYPSNGASTPDQHWWTRLKVVDKVFYVKTWHITQHEPLQWSRIYVDNDPILSGKVGISGTTSGGNDWYTEYFAVAVNKPSLQIPSQPTNFDRSMWGVSYCYFGYANSGGDTFRLSGGVWDLEGQEITGFDIQNSDYHSTQARLAVYVSYEPLKHLIENDAKVTPDDAVLLCELGLTTGTTIDDRFHADLGTPVRIPNGVTYLWIAVKANSGFGISGTDAYPAVPSNFDSHNDAWVYDSGVSFDTSVAFPNDLSAASGGHRLVNEGHVPCAIHISPIALVQLEVTASAQSSVPNPSASLNPEDGFAVRSYAQSKTVTKEGIIDFIVTDFSEYDNGNASDVLTDWSYLVLEESPTIAVTETPSIITSPSSGKVLVTPDTADYREEIITWDKIGKVTDFDLVLRTTLNYRDSYIAFRHNGLSKTMAEYYYWEMSYLGVNLARKNHGTLAIDRWSSVFFNYNQYTDVWVRVRAEGNVLQIKVWPGDQFEPADWTYSITDTDTDYYSDKQASILTPGFVGIGGQSYVNEIDIMAVAIEGKTVPFPPIGSVLDSSEWGSDTSGGSPSAIDSTYVQGGSFPAEEYDRVLKAIKVKAGTVTGDIRIAVYSGGSLANGPDGATLLYDFGVKQLTSSGWSEYLCNSVLVPEDQPVWVAWKSTDSVPIYRDSLAGSAGNFQKDHGAFIISDGVDPDADTPWPTTIDVTSGAYDDTVKYYHQFILRFDKKWVPEELFIEAVSAAISYTNAPDALLQIGVSLDVTSSAQSSTNVPDATLVTAIQAVVSSNAQSSTNTPDAQSSENLQVTVSSTAQSLTNDADGTILVGISSSSDAESSTNQASAHATIGIDLNSLADSLTNNADPLISISLDVDSSAISDTTNSIGSLNHKLALQSDSESFTNDAPSATSVNVTATSSAVSTTTDAEALLTVTITSDSDAVSSTNDVDSELSSVLLVVITSSAQSASTTPEADLSARLLINVTASAQSETNGVTASTLIKVDSSSDAESLTNDCDATTIVNVSADSQGQSLTNDPEPLTDIFLLSNSGAESSTNSVGSGILVNAASASDAQSLTNTPDADTSSGIFITSSSDAVSSTTDTVPDILVHIESQADANSETNSTDSDVLVSIITSSNGESLTTDAPCDLLNRLDTSSSAVSGTGECSAVLISSVLSTSVAESFTNIAESLIVANLSIQALAESFTNDVPVDSTHALELFSDGVSETNDADSRLTVNISVTSDAVSYTGDPAPSVKANVTCLSIGRSYTNIINGHCTNNLTGEGPAVSNTNDTSSLVSVIAGYVDGDSFVRNAPNIEYIKKSEPICK